MTSHDAIIRASADAHRRALDGGPLTSVHWRERPGAPDPYRTCLHGATNRTLATRANFGILDLSSNPTTPVTRRPTSTSVDTFGVRTCQKRPVEEPPMRTNSSTPRRARPRRALAGFSLLEAMIAVAVVAVVAAAVTSVSVQGARDQRGARDRQEVALAAADRLGGTVPASAGGAVAPDPAVDGWWDVVTPGDGGYVAFDPKTTREGAIVIRRQWRLAAAANGGRTLDVSAEIVDPVMLQAVAGRDGYALVLSRTMR